MKHSDSAEKLKSSLSLELGLLDEPQDWGIVNADGSRTMEFITYFEDRPDLPPNLKFCLGELILASANEQLLDDASADIKDVIAFIKRHGHEFDAHVEYWKKLDDLAEFPISTQLTDV